MIVMGPFNFRRKTFIYVVIDSKFGGLETIVAGWA